MKTKKRTRLGKSALRLRNILVPIDFSENARQALEYAIPLANQSGARITLLHVYRTVVYPAEMGIVVPDGESQTSAKARKHLIQFGQKMLPEAMRGKMLVRNGEPFDEISRVARRAKIDLIICTTHGYTGLKHVVLGSTAERVVRYAPCPVLTIRVR